MLDSDSTLIDTARALRLQFLRAGLNVGLRRVGIAELDERGRSGRYDLMLAPMPAGREAMPFYRSDTSLNQTGWRNKIFDAALDRHDEAEAARVFAAEVPALPLFEFREFAAIDARFCGGQPTSTTSWRWLADLYPCEDGDR